MLRVFFVFLGIGLLTAHCTECPPCSCETDISTSKPVSKEKVNPSDISVSAAPVGDQPKPVTSYPLHARAGFMRVNVFEQPDMDTPRLGYFRKGARTMVGDPRFSSESCPKGWFKLKEGGYVCQGRGMLVGTKPRFIPKPPPEANTDELDPYRHGFVRNDWTPAYKRMPTEDSAIWTPPLKEELEGTDAEVDAGATGEPEYLPHDEKDENGGINYYKYTKRKFRNVSQLLERGFWISVGKRDYDSNTHKYYYETIKGLWVPAESVHLIKPPRFKGYEVTGETPLPGAIVQDRRSAFFRRRANNRFGGAGPVDRLLSFRVFEAANVGRLQYYKINNERWLKSNQVAYFEMEPPPDSIKDKEKWIRINLKNQTLVAYEGAMPVYATLVSTGLPDSEETVTPKGTFSINFKHLTDDMTGTVGDDDAYSVEDVPWVQYIHQNIALHAAFWHSAFGSPKSHGCINLSPADARWLFNWTDPPLPDKWHAVAATKNNPGTQVFIVGNTPGKKKK